MKIISRIFLRLKFWKKVKLTPVNELNEATIKTMKREQTLDSLRRASEELDIPVEDLTVRKV